MIEHLGDLQYFYFLRPWWLLLVPLALTLWWRIRRRAMSPTPLPGGLAPHLAAALTVGGPRARKLLAIDGAVAAIALAALAAAGPSWTRVPNPLVAQTAPLAIVLKVSESMLAGDVVPSRLERAQQKILDVIAARAGGRTALIAYAGTAHRVVPLTEDPAVLKPFVEGLGPDVMPQEGQNATAALALAVEALAGEAVPGAILFVLDGLDRADLAGFAQHTAADGAGLVFLSLDGSGEALSHLRSIEGASVIEVTANAADVAEIGRQVASAYRDALARDENQRWDDRGWMLAWPAALLVLLWFRRGWTMRWSLAVLALTATATVTAPSGPARADGIADWFLTPDQQGRLAYESKDFSTAADLFQDSLWRGQALYKAGRYAEAVQVYARLESAEAAFGQGMAHLKIREYRRGITAFEAALAREPGHTAAARNLEIARAILAYIERVRLQSDTREGSEGADDVVFDKEAEGGIEIEITTETEMRMQTAEEWMRSVDTRTADFLRSRFALEAARDRGQTVP